MGCDRSHLLSMTASLQSGPEILIPNTGIAAASLPDKGTQQKLILKVNSVLYSTVNLFVCTGPVS